MKFILIFFFQKSFKVSKFEERLMQEVQFREGKFRRPAEMSEDEVAFDEHMPVLETKPPKIEQKLKNIKMMEGSDATFVCKIKGHPRPKVRRNVLNNKPLMSY